MRHLTTRLWLPILLLGGAAWLAFRHAVLGDWRGDSSPAVAAIAHGHLDAYLHAKPIMGPFATLFEAPFSLLGGDLVGRYEWACFGCLLVLAGLGWYLAEVARRRGATPAAQMLIGILCVINPITLEAIQMGHPEELLTTALAVGAVALAIGGRGVAAPLCLGLAIASKQWAVLATFPVLMALSERRIRACLIAGGVVALFFLPALVVAPDAFWNVQSNAASGGRLATIWSSWFPLSPATPRVLADGGVTMVHEQPALAQSFTHFLIVASMVAVPVALWLRRGRFRLDGAEPLALFSLLALLRCGLDPVDNLYYHLPLLIGLIAWDAYDSERLPLRTLAGSGIALLFWYWSRELGSLALFNAAYLTVVTGVAVMVAAKLLHSAPRTRPAFSRPLPLRD